MTSPLLLGAGVAIAALLLAVTYLAYRSYNRRADLKRFEARLAEAEAESGDGTAAPLDPVDVRSTLWGLVKSHRHRVKAKKLANRGYVRWFKLGSSMQAPRWVQPERDGSGVPKYYDKNDEQHYLFPEDALVMDARTGAWMAIHHKGEAEPVPIREPEMPALDGDRLEEVINLEAESDPPSWLGQLDLDMGTLMMLAVGALFVVFAAMRMLG